MQLIVLIKSVSSYSDYVNKNYKNNFAANTIAYYLCRPLLKKGKSSSLKKFIAQYIFVFLQKDLVGKIKALTFALPNKNGWSKKGQKIFESLEVTAQNFYNSTR